MKLLLKFLLILISVAFVLGSCDSKETYADQLKAEKKLISDFISRQKIIVVETKPKTVPYENNVYYKTPSGLYIHLTSKGDDLSDSVEVNDLIVFRYSKYTLNAVADTISYLNTVDNPFPLTFNFYDLTQKQSCEAWHEAVSFMKYNNAEAKIIVISKLGNSTDESAVIPYGYDVRIKIRK